MFRHFLFMDRFEKNHTFLDLQNFLFAFTLVSLITVNYFYLNPYLFVIVHFLGHQNMNLQCLLVCWDRFHYQLSKIFFISFNLYSILLVPGLKVERFLALFYLGKLLFCHFNHSCWFQYHLLLGMYWSYF